MLSLIMSMFNDIDRLGRNNHPLNHLIKLVGTIPTEIQLALVQR